ncbi:hypothetical protein [Streptomyces sp. NPDC007088]|uniref:hypothetical protein n=1 Tax=Streptomyces sp. NPDC007088 TaxID=3364773 RepID=UPI00368DB76D
MTPLAADRLASSYSVKLNASGTDVEVMRVRALQEQPVFGHTGWLADLSDRAGGEKSFRRGDVQPEGAAKG